jgi:hypothetical protein
MSDIKQALAQVASGDPKAGATFGLERRYSTGMFAVLAGIYEWEQRLQLSGQGIARAAVYRSLGDRGGDPTGIYQTTFSPEQVRDLAGLALDSGILDYDAGHIEPGDLMIRIRFAALGIMHDVFLSMDITPEEEKIRQFLTTLTKLDKEVRKHPFRTLTITASVTGEIPKAGARKRVPILLTLRNEGPQGHWVRNPAAMIPDGQLERRYVTWARKPEMRPGETSLPTSFVNGALEPAATRGPQYAVIWLAPQSETKIECSAIVNFPSAGTYYFKAGFTTFEGGHVYEGAGRWVGGVFSQAIELEVPR